MKKDLLHLSARPHGSFTEVPLITLLACMLLFQDKLGCSGCCSHHGGIKCFNGVTRCADGTPLSSKCLTCNACGTQSPKPTPTTPAQPAKPPTYLPPQVFGWDAQGDFICVLPSPNRDGLCPEGGGYTVTLRERNILIRGMDNLRIESDFWPVVFSIPGGALPEVFTVAIRRVCGTSTSEEWILTAPKRPTTTQEPTTSELDRWLLHVPKRAGGFAGVVRIVNLNPDSALAADLFAYSDAGLLLEKARVTLNPDETRYLTLYEAGGLFADLTDKVSHIGIRDGSNALRVSLGYKVLSSGYTVWHNEDAVQEGSVTGAIQLVEANAQDASAEGVAMLNLANDHEIQVTVKQVTAAGETLASQSLGTLEPGVKKLAVLSALFPRQEGTHYQLETELGESFQVLGLSFSGSFFTTAETQILR